MRMRFGCHKGEEVAALPDAYLRWLSAQEWLYPPRAAAVAAELRARAADVPPARSAALPAALVHRWRDRQRVPDVKEVAEDQERRDGHRLSVLPKNVNRQTPTSPVLLPLPSGPVV